MKITHDHPHTIAALCFVAALLSLSPISRGQSSDRPKRARLPEWDSRWDNVFFANPFRDGLRGARPSTLGISLSAPSNTPLPSTSGDPGDQQDAASRSTAWSQLISASTLEDEIKRIERAAREAVQNQGHFQGRGYRVIREQFGIAAILFSIIQQYDKSTVRWQQEADTLRQQLARSSANSKVGTRQSWRQAKQGQQDLFDVIRGGQIDTLPEREVVWPEVAERPIMMQRLDHAVEDSLAGAVARQETFEKQTSAVRHEAELVAALSQILKHPDMADALDDEYQSFCDSMQSAARDLVIAADQSNYDNARAAHAELKRSCVNCHDLYR